VAEFGFFVRTGVMQLDDYSLGAQSISCAVKVTRVPASPEARRALSPKRLGRLFLAVVPGRMKPLLQADQGEWFCRMKKR